MTTDEFSALLDSVKAAADQAKAKMDAGQLESAYALTLTMNDALAGAIAELAPSVRVKALQAQFDAAAKGTTT